MENLLEEKLKIPTNVYNIIREYNIMYTISIVFDDYRFRCNILDYLQTNLYN